MQDVIYRGSYTHMKLLNEPLARLIDLRWNDHECMIPFII